MSADDGGRGWRTCAGAGLRHSGLSPCCGRGLLEGEDALVLVKEVLALDLELGLEGGFLGSPGCFLLLDPLQFLVMESGGPQMFLSKCGGLRSKCFADTLLESVDGFGGRLELRLAVTGSNASHVEATGLDGGCEVDGGAGVGDLAGH